MPEKVICQIGSCQIQLNSLIEYENHYNTRHKNVCSDCKRYFLSEKVLNIHISEWHDPFFDVKLEKGYTEMYHCLEDGCNDSFNKSNERKEHMISYHKYPASFKFCKIDYSKKRNCSHMHGDIKGFSNSCKCCNNARNNSNCNTLTQNSSIYISFGHTSVTRNHSLDKMHVLEKALPTKLV